MSYIFKGVSGALFSVAAGAFSLFFQFFAAKYYGAESYGEASYFFGVASTISLFFLFGQQYYLSKKRLKKEDFSKIFFGILTVFLISLIISLPWLLHFFKFTDVVFFILIAINIIIIDLNGAYYIRFNQPQLASFYKGFLFRLLSVFFLVVFYFFYKSYYSILLSILIPLLVISIIQISKNVRITKPNFKQLFNVFYLIQIMNLAINYLALIFQKHYSNYILVGVLALCIAISNALNLVSLNIANSVLPKFSELLSNNGFKRIENQIEINNIYKSIVRTNAFILIPVTIYLIIFSKEILGIFGKSYASGAIILPIILIGQSINVLSGPNGSVILMSNKNYFEIFNGIIKTSINIIIIIVFAPHYYWGVALAISVSEVVGNFLKSIEVYFFYKVVPYDFKTIKYLVLWTFSESLILLFLYLGIDSKIKLLCGLVFLFFSILLKYKFSTFEEDRNFFNKIFNYVTRRK